MHDQRKTSYEETKDYVPTPPWATRAFLEASGLNFNGISILEPCVGEGHLAQVLTGAGATVYAHDLIDYGYPGTVVQDFLENKYANNSFDWCVTNPPFALAEEFFHEMRRIASVGVVVHIRTTWLNGVGRWNRVFGPDKPDVVAVRSSRCAASAGTRRRLRTN